MSLKLRLANLLSVVFTPLFAPTYLFALILFYFPFLSTLPDLKAKIIALILILIFTILPPFLLVYALFKLGKVSTLMLDDRKDRIIPQIFACVNYLFILIFLIYNYSLDNGLTLSMLAMSISTIVITIINTFWKISTHACGIAGIASIFYFLTYKYSLHSPTYLIYLMVLIVFCVCVARLYLKAHTFLQILAGLILGSFVGWCCFSNFN